MVHSTVRLIKCQLGRRLLWLNIKDSNCILFPGLFYVFCFQLFLVLTVQSFVKTFPLTLKILKFKIKLCALSGFTQYWINICLIKGSDRLCKVVELSTKCCGKLLSESFGTYLTFLRSVNPSLGANLTFETPTLGVDTFSELVFFNY